MSLVLLSACRDGTDPLNPDRPPGMPESAVWYGGLDGGEWVHCNLQKGTLDCEFYWQRSGNLKRTQKFILCGDENASNWMGFASGINFDVNVRDYGLYWRPVSAPHIYRDGKISEELTAKAAIDFEEEIAARSHDGGCSISLIRENAEPPKNSFPFKR